MTSPEQRPLTDVPEWEPPIDNPVIRTTPLKKYDEPRIGTISSEDPAFKLPGEEDAEVLPDTEKVDTKESAVKHSRVKRVVRGLAGLVRGRRGAQQEEDETPPAIEAAPVLSDLEAAPFLTVKDIEFIAPTPTAPPRPAIGSAPVLVEHPTTQLPIWPQRQPLYTPEPVRPSTPPQAYYEDPTAVLDFVPYDGIPNADNTGEMPPEVGQYWAAPDQTVPERPEYVEPRPTSDPAINTGDLMASGTQVLSDLTKSLPPTEDPAKLEQRQRLFDKFYGNLRGGRVEVKEEPMPGFSTLKDALSDMTQAIPRMSEGPTGHSAEEMPDRTQEPLGAAWLRSQRNRGQQ